MPPAAVADTLASAIASSSSSSGQERADVDVDVDLDVSPVKLGLLWRVTGKGTYNGTVTKASATDFSWSTTDEPHATRRKLIMAKYPQIQSLFGPEPLTFWIVVGVVTFQTLMAYWMRDAHWGLLLLCAYVIGGTLNHSMQLASHELSHNLCFHSVLGNKLTALLSNLPTGFPSTMSFQRYHMDHHQFQGVDGVDTDIPCEWEVSYFTSVVLKIVWIMLQPFMYAFRPMFIKPKPLSTWEVINWITALSYDGAIIYFMGTRSFSYLILGTLLGLGLHPSAGHFIAEHYEFVKGQETYSYYGPMNFFNFNVGYHNEHHDFPRIPWSRLAEVRRIAPEFYDILPSYDSYLTVFWRYVTDGELGPYSRIKRTTTERNMDILRKQDGAASVQPFKIVCISAMASVCGFVAYSAVF